MITKDQALTAQEFHYTGRHNCTRYTGPRGAVKEHITVARRNGATQVWKRFPTRFRVPVKHGLRDYGEITDINADDWHIAADCPLKRQGENCA